MSTDDPFSPHAIRSTGLCNGCVCCIDPDCNENECYVRRLISMNVRRLRHARELTQQELSDRAGIDRTHLARLEAHATNISLRIFLKLARALEQDPRELLAPREEWS